MQEMTAELVAKFTELAEKRSNNTVQEKVEHHQRWGWARIWKYSKSMKNDISLTAPQQKENNTVSVLNLTKKLKMPSPIILSSIMFDDIHALVSKFSCTHM